MVYRIIWSTEVIEDLESIGGYIKRDSPHYAKTVISKIIKSIKYISQDW